MPTNPINSPLLLLTSVLLLLNAGPLIAKQSENDLTVVEKLVDVQHDLFDGPRQGQRSNHTKGIVVTGSFTPATNAKTVSTAGHLQNDATPITVRFSNSTGFPDIADNNPKALVKGMAVRFDLGEAGYHDLVLSSVPRFPVATPEKFLEMLTAVRDSASSDASPTPIENFLNDNPTAKAFVNYPKPYPKSFASLSYHGINAFKFTNATGDSVFGRYIVVPAINEQFLSAAEGQQQNADYLINELPNRLQGSAVVMRLALQLANADDMVNDATVIWPEERPVVELGVLRLTAMHTNAAAYEKATMFNPLALPDGIEPSADPILLARPGAYAVSFQHRLD